MSVLVVEGYADLRAAIVDTLERSDVACVTAASPEEAILKLRERQYEAILLAPRLPIRSDPVMQFLHETQPGEVSKVILLADVEDEEARSAECRVLTKPFNHDELIAKLVDR